MGGKHRHKYAVANKMVAYATQVTGIQHPFFLLPDLYTDVPENCIAVLKSEYEIIDVLDPVKNPFDLYVRLPTNSRHIEFQASLEVSLSSSQKPLTQFAESCIDYVMDKENKTLRDIYQWRFSELTNNPYPDISPTDLVRAKVADILRERERPQHPQKPAPDGCFYSE